MNNLTYGRFMIMEWVTRRYFSMNEKVITLDVIQDSVFKSNESTEVQIPRLNSHTIQL